ncbi:MAG: hypothetical protein ACTHU0_33780 [Kofleriaceae bacterium]
MQRALALAGLAVIVGCGRSHHEPRRDEPRRDELAGSAAALPTAKTPAPDRDRDRERDRDRCSELPFAESTPVPEASGAAWLEIDGKLGLVVISDSGNDGAYGVIDPETGETLEQGKLPLGGDGADLEGIAARGNRLYVISSPGWIRVYERAAGKFALVDGPYPLGPIDLDDKGGGLGDKPPKGNGMVCGATHTNCGRNYEGLCLAPPSALGPGVRCAGFAAAKADGHLYCIVERNGKLSVEYADAIKVARPGVIADCAFSDDGALYVGSNLFDLAAVYRVDGWRDPGTASGAKLGSLGVGFPETIAVRGDVIYRMSDTGGSGPSLMKKFRCRP